MACGTTSTVCSVNNKIADGKCSEVTLTLPTLPTNIKKPKIPTVKDVTTEAIDGTGVFDIYMRAGMNQLNTQYDKGRIKGADFAAAYIAQMQLMMTEANKFVLGLAQAEMSLLMFEQQYMGAAYDALAKEAQAKKLKFDSDLVCQQVAELKLNGASKRNLEAAQRDGACQQVDLYKAQAKGFADKNRNDTFKTVMNAWAINAVEVDSDSMPVSELSDVGAGATLRSAKMQAGIS